IKDNELFFASKSTNEGPFVGYFKDIFFKTFKEEQIETIREKIEKDNLSFVFEVIDPINDPHIIEYNEPKIVLLDMIYNATEYSKISYEELKTFGKSNNIEVKELIYTANDMSEFNKIYEEIISDNYMLNGEYIEGFVIEDSNVFMVKTKTFYYDKWKRLRGKMEKSIKSNDFNIKSKDELEPVFIEFLKNKYENKEVDVKNINIINERKEYEDIK
ncbi:MAG: T4 RnlA family RNA ligase, partial [Bacilli bacterium]|nr:T4 RnlA family RNA ligase [Bacilli bacterium]